MKREMKLTPAQIAFARAQLAAGVSPLLVAWALGMTRSALIRALDRADEAGEDGQGVGAD